MRSVQFVSGGVAGSVIYGPYDSNPGSRRVHYAAGAPQPAPSSFRPSISVPPSFSFFPLSCFALALIYLQSSGDWLVPSQTSFHCGSSSFLLINATIFATHETTQLSIPTLFSRLPKPFQAIASTMTPSRPLLFQSSAIITPPPRPPAPHPHVSVNGKRNTWIVQVNAFWVLPCPHCSLWQAPFVILYPRIKHRHWTPRATPLSLSLSLLLCCCCLGGCFSLGVNRLFREASR